jgi:hypothetical protein
MEPILQAQAEFKDRKQSQTRTGRLRIIPYCYVQTVDVGPVDDQPGYATQCSGVHASVRRYPKDLRSPPGSFARDNGVDIAPLDYLDATPLIVKARIVVASGGAIQTPALLLRSGLTNPKIGKHLALHTVTALAGYFPDVDVNGASGVPMGVVVNDPPIEADGPGESGWRFANMIPCCFLCIL